MWKDRRPAEPDMTRTSTEAAIDRRDRTIREMIDELVRGTRELKATYEGGPSDRPKPTQ
jgi:hypothetical protein